MFRTREIYSKRLGAGEEFDTGCMCISSFGEENTRHLVVGSFAGILRVFSVPNSYADAKAEASKGDNALLEERLSAPILQVASGRLVSTSDRTYLAVLHPRKLVVYTVNGGNELGSKSSSMLTIKVAYEHALARTATNMVCNSFGTNSRREFICVQSTDCTLTLFEQETLVFNCFLADCLLPSRFVYIRSKDSFVLVHGDTLRAFKHRTLAASASPSAGSEDTSSGTSAHASALAQRIRADWKIVLGQRCVDLAVCDHPDAENSQSVLCVGEEQIFCVSDAGKLRFSQKLTYEPVSVYAYNVGRAQSRESGSLNEAATNGAITVNYIVGTRSSVLLVYENATLKWACRTDFMPVQIAISNLGTLQGVLLQLAEHGLLSVSFLGTEPCIAVRGALGTTASLTQEQQSKLNEELRSLQHVVRETASGNQNALPMPRPSATDDELALTVALSGADDFRSAASNCTLTVTLRTKAVCLANVVVSAACRPPLRASPQTMAHFRSFDSRSAASQNFVVFKIDYESSAINDAAFQSESQQEGNAAAEANNTPVPTDLRVLVYATYSPSDLGPAGRVAVAQTRLPFGVLARTCTVQKEAQHKVTFSVSESASSVSLADLFRDLVEPGSSLSYQGGAVLGLRLADFHQVVSILATRGKFRVQCDRADLLYVPVRTLLDRLQASVSGLQCSAIKLHGKPAVDALVAQINATFACRMQTMEKRAQLAKHAALFREVQKRAFAKYKEDAASQAELPETTSSKSAYGQKEDAVDDSVANLESLLDDAHSQLLQAADDLATASQAYRAALSSLESVLKLVAVSSQMALALGAPELRALEAVLLVEHVAIIADQPLCVTEAALPENSDSEVGTSQQSTKTVPGWEELVDAVLVYTLKQTAAGNKADRVDAASLQAPKSVEKLCKHVRIFFDKLLNKQVDLTHIGTQMNLLTVQSDSSPPAAGVADLRKPDERNASHSRSTSEKAKENTQSRLDLVNKFSSEREEQPIESPQSLLSKLPKLEPNSRKVPSNMFSGALDKLRGDAEQPDNELEPEYSKPIKANKKQSDLQGSSSERKRDAVEDDYF